jgi:hypothetical protein
MNIHLFRIFMFFFIHYYRKILQIATKHFLKKRKTLRAIVCFYNISTNDSLGARSALIDKKNFDH